VSNVSYWQDKKVNNPEPFKRTAGIPHACMMLLDIAIPI
jgi:hypothetical protein